MLRATCATRYYDNSVKEQIVQEFTGHRSLAVCGYKRTSMHQKRKASEALYDPYYEQEGPIGKVMHTD